VLGLFCFVRLTCFSFLTSLGKHRFLRKSNITGVWRFSSVFFITLPFANLFSLHIEVEYFRHTFHSSPNFLSCWYNLTHALQCSITCVGARPSCGKEKMWYGKTFVASGSRRWSVFSSCWNTFWASHRFPVTNLLTCQNPNSGGRNWRERWGGGGRGGTTYIHL